MHTYMYSFAPLRSILAQREQHDDDDADDDYASEPDRAQGRVRFGFWCRASERTGSVIGLGVAWKMSNHAKCWRRRRPFAVLRMRLAYPSP